MELKKLFEMDPISIDPDMTQIIGNVIYKGMYQSAYRVCRFLFPVLNELDFGAYFKNGPDMYVPKDPYKSQEWDKIARFYSDEGTGMVVVIHNKQLSFKRIPCLCFVRKTEEDLKDYPRINLPSTFKQMQDSLKIPAMLQEAKSMNLHFLVMIVNEKAKFNSKPALYWFGRVADIPEQHWALTWRYKKTNLDRMHILASSKFVKSFTQRELKLKQQIQNSLKK